MLAGDGSDEAVRHEIETRFGATVLAELVLAIASARVSPTVKRGLGLALSCSSAADSMPLLPHCELNGPRTAKGVSPEEIWLDLLAIRLLAGSNEDRGDTGRVVRKL